MKKRKRMMMILNLKKTKTIIFGSTVVKQLLAYLSVRISDHGLWMGLGELFVDQFSF